MENIAVDRLNWRQACDLLGCSKSTLYRLVARGVLRASGVTTRHRWFSRRECLALLASSPPPEGGRHHPERAEKV